MLWSLPNLLTLSRIVAILPILVLMFWREHAWAAWWALGIYTFACVTDYLDGWLARRNGEESPIGVFLDPIADKLLVGALLLMMAGTDRLTVWALPAAIVILLREILVSGLREFLAGLRQVKLPVSHLAKWKTTTQMVALGILIVGKHGPYFDQAWLDIGAVGLWVAAIITLITGWDYMVVGLKHMLEPQEKT